MVYSAAPDPFTGIKYETHIDSRTGRVEQRPTAAYTAWGQGFEAHMANRNDSQGNSYFLFKAGVCLCVTGIGGLAGYAGSSGDGDGGTVSLALGTIALIFSACAWGAGCWVGCRNNS